MLLSELYKTMVNKVTFVGFRGEIAAIALANTAQGYREPRFRYS